MQHLTERFQKQDSSTFSEAPPLQPRATFKESAERQGTERIREAEHGEIVIPLFRNKIFAISYKTIAQLKAFDYFCSQMLFYVNRTKHTEPRRRPTHR